MTRYTLCLLSVSGSALLAGAVPAARTFADDMGGMKMPATAPSTQPMASNKLCPVTKEPVDASMPTVEYKGKTIGFCCPDCVKSFKENPDKYMADLK